MKINHVVVGLLIVFAFFAGRWFSPNASIPPTAPAIAGAGMQTQPPPAVKERLTQLQSAQKNPSLPPSGKPSVVYPSLPQPPMTRGKPEVVRNVGPLIDPDPGKSTTTYMGPDRPVQNVGAFIEPGGPHDSNR
ncbi:MAG: hypothetical protein DM484_06595 [Candidatus Methylumidiphilus alinenensis]|uniref:Uncharacterized protein n=1 Tax=Candidatus Methylumidiphilus alinenensis TaxID=2202197 RepID=A0A2W4REH6_9GAMM|nr:MAG: hypothetical protein DM484_06595 [Candidatus Methylumidiphilus alinenensis]